MKRFRCGFLLLLLGVCAHAAPASNPRVDFNQTILPNGLKVLFVEDHSAPVVAVSVVYDVGSRNEREGLTGFAHLFEHMMFKGSQNVGDGEHFFQVFSNGGTMNGSTNADVTLYYETLPANQLELALFLEGDRMRSLAITQEKLDNQRQAVQEERRLRLDNQPYGKADERFGELMYDNFAYKHSVIGSMADLNAASVADVAKFFKTYYAPNNAVLSVVGDFKRGTAEQLVRKYFASIPSQAPPPAVDLSEPEQKAERRETMVDPLARMAQVQIGYKTGTGNEPDQDALQILSTVLQGGNSSRLYQELTKEKELVVDVGGFVDRRIGPSALLIGATVRPGRKVEDVEAAIYAEIDNLQQQPISAAELEKAKTASRLSYLQQIRSSQTRAILLGTYAVKFNDPNLVNTRLDRINAVTAADVQQVAQRYLQAKNRTVVIAKPVGG
ncbi:MAG TPA: pitrilysin family protein [Steroidobacteraceae bacterium]|nr:pitrilysin family protein [Steroidobacteraceae bacterium]